MDLNQFISDIDKIMPAFEAEFKERVTQRTPVSTADKGDVGLLKRSWNWETIDNTRCFTNDAVNKDGVPYGVYVEYGTYKMAPRAMVGTTILEVDDIMKQAVQKAGL